MAKNTATPTNPAELADMLTDGQAMAEMFRAGANGDTEPFEEWIANYTKTISAKDPGIEAQNREAFELNMLNWLREHGATEAAQKLNLNFDAINSKRVGKHEIYNKNALGAPYDKSFATFEDFMYTITDKAYKTPETSRTLKEMQNAASSMKPSDGGFLIPEFQRAEVLRLAMENSIVRSRARVIPMDSLRVPFPTIDKTSHASSIYGGIIGFWTEEGATLTESKPKFGRIVLEAHKLTLYVEVPNELLYDSRPSYQVFIEEMFPEAIGWFEDVAFFVGRGVGEPLGIFNAGCRVGVTRTTSNLVKYDDVVNMYSRMLPQSLSRAVWLCAPDVLPQLFKMVLTGGTSPLWIGGGGFVSAADNPPMALLGRPLIITEKARTLGTEGDLSLVDFGSYLIGDRQAMTARQSEDFRFSTDVTAYRVTERIDGRPWVLSPITPQNNSANTLSPIITILA